MSDNSKKIEHLEDTLYTAERIAGYCEDLVDGSCSEGEKILHIVNPLIKKTKERIEALEWKIIHERRAQNRC